MTDYRGVLEIARGFIWHNGHDDCEVVAVTPRGGRLMYQVRTGEEYAELSEKDLVTKVVADVWATHPAAGALADHGRVLNELPNDVARDLIALESELLEAATGYRTRLPAPGERPNPRFDPSRVGSTERKKRKAKDLGIAVSTLYEKLKAYESGGLPGLIHGNRNTSSDPLARFDPAAVEVIRRFCSSQAARSTRTKRNTIAMAQVALEDAGFTGWGYGRIDRVIREVTRGASLYGPARTRLSKKARDVSGGGWSSVPPGLVLQVDTSPCDFTVWSPGPKGHTNAWAVFLKDVGGKDWSCLLTTEPPNARALGVALFRRLNPQAAVAGAPYLAVGSLPSKVDLAIDDNLRLGGLDPVVPAEIHMDRGREGENEAFLGLCAQLGIHVVFGRPRTGSDKPHVEAAFHMFAELSELFPGHKGNEVRNRGEHPERGDLLTLAEAQLLIDMISETVLDLPHSELRHPADPSKRLTIRQHRNASAINGVPLRITVHQNLLYEFLPAHRATVNGRGPTIKNITYSTTDGDLMERLRAMSAGDRKVDGRKLVFRRDPYDVSRVFWQEPGTIRWHVLTAIGEEGQFLQPFSSDWWQEVKRMEPQVRLAKNASVTVAKSNLRLLQRLQRLSSNRDEQAREFARLLNAVPNPAPSTNAGPSLGVLPAAAWVEQDLDASRSGDSGVHATNLFEASGDLDALTDEDLEDDQPW